MVLNATFTCFTSGSLNDIGCILGNGLGGLFGGSIIATLIIMIGTLIFLYRMHLQPELIAVIMVCEFLIMVFIMAPTWMFWVLILLLLILAGFGYSKFFKRHT
jgi:hypothetical protein